VDRLHADDQGDTDQQVAGAATSEELDAALPGRAAG
jgi:hypothetical protein